MIREMEEAQCPQWLRVISAERIKHRPFPLSQVLEKSLYYPACELDGDPVKFLAGNVYSFVYVDYGVGRKNLLENLEWPQGFYGYELVGKTDLTENDLAPSGWRPILPTSHDGRPEQFRQYTKEGFASWVVFERNPNFGPSHGPDRFSLLYIGGDGAATFQALYHTNRIAPHIIAVIQPGTGFGLNWTDFCDPNKILARSVLGNPTGKPRYLLVGGWGSHYDSPCWPEYSQLVRFLKPNNQLGLWKRPETGAE